MKKEAILALSAVCLLAGCGVVNPGERGVKVSLGSMDKNLVQPGMFGYNPLTDQVIHYTVQQWTSEGEASPLTADQQPIKIQFKVQCNIPESQVLTLYEKYQGDPYDKLVAPQVQEAFRAVVSNYKSDSATKNVNEIKNKVLVAVREAVGGLVNVVDIPITHVDLPETLQQAIAQKQVMEQQALQKTYELDKAKKEAEITVANAEAQAKSIKLQSDALERSPQLTQYKAVEKWDGKLPLTLIMGKDNGNFLMNLKGGQ